MEISTWRTDAGDLDILADIPDRPGRHLRYAELLARANTVIVAGIPVYVASLDDVIASKEWANRPKDHEALPELYDLREQDLGPDEAPPTDAARRCGLKPQAPGDARQAGALNPTRRTGLACQPLDRQLRDVCAQAEEHRTALVRGSIEHARNFNGLVK
jgi:hypothetical protein